MRALNLRLQSGLLARWQVHARDLCTERMRDAQAGKPLPLALTACHYPHLRGFGFARPTAKQHRYARATEPTSRSPVGRGQGVRGTAAWYNPNIIASPKRYWEALPAVSPSRKSG